MQFTAKSVPSPDELAAAGQELLKRRLDALASEVVRSVLFGRSNENEALASYADATGKLLLASNLRGYRDLVQELDSRREPGAFMPGDAARAEVRSLVAADMKGVLDRYSRGLDIQPWVRQESIDRYVFGRPFEMAWSASQALTNAARGILVRSMRDGIPNPEARRMIHELHESFTPAYAETVVRTGLASAHAAGRERAAEHPDIAPTVWGFEFSATLDSDVRENHKKAHGFLAPANDYAWDLLTPPLGFNCFPGDTPVEGRVEGASRLFYDGKILEIVTESGARLVVTPNHPIATANGFVPAGKLKAGAQVLRKTVRVGTPSEQIYDYQEPTTIEDVFCSLAKSGGISRLGIVRDDFYGDAERGNGEVEIVTVDGHLAHHIAAPQESLYPSLVCAEAGAVTERLKRRGSRDCLCLGRRPLSPSAPGGRALALNGGPAHKRPLQFLRLGSGSRFDICREEAGPNSSASDTNLVRELLLRFPGEISIDKIVRIDVRAFRGHVYDLQTDTGYFIACGIVVSNCRCIKRLVTKQEFNQKHLSKSRGIPEGAGPDSFKFGKRP